MAEELLDRADVMAILQQVRGERVPERMAAGVFLDAGGAHAERHCALHRRFFQMVTPPLPAARIDRDPPCREDILPGKLSTGVFVLPLQRVRQPDLAETLSQIRAMDAARLLDLSAERLAEMRKSKALRAWAWVEALTFPPWPGASEMR